MTIDTHVHFWKYDRKRDGWMDDMKILQQDYLPETIASTLKRNGIDGCVAVQADPSEVETRFLVELAKTHDIIKGVVGWIDFQANDVAERLQHFAVNPSIKGYRHIVQSEPHEFLLGKKFQSGVAALKEYGYTYDLLIYHHQLKPAVEFVSKFPEQKLVLDHCGKPSIRNKDIKEWSILIREMALHPNVYCKLSGLFTEANWKDWSAADFYPYLDVVFDAFGVDRLMFGSDWPVILVAGMYVQWKSLLEKYMENYSEEDREKVFGSNAVQFYNL
ncbi:MAG: amidohydrolase family protein [Terrimonas sp.]|nr:amidohydrolase family protein [Terrimonas sp.]OJY93951.1 MAG: amidohydrolase [Sphingobacteriales bacterium 40-81]